MDISDLMDLKGYVEEKLGDRLGDSNIAFAELNLSTTSADIVSVLKLLRDDVQTQFVCLIDICGVDYPERRERFEIVYHLLSPRQNLRLRVRVNTDADTPVPSVVQVYPGADWFEREAYDLYGIIFRGHPALRRLLTHDDFVGHALRKDYPVDKRQELRRPTPFAEEL